MLKKDITQEIKSSKSEELFELKLSGKFIEVENAFLSLSNKSFSCTVEGNKEVNIYYNTLYIYDIPEDLMIEGYNPEREKIMKGYKFSFECYKKKSNINRIDMEDIYDIVSGKKEWEEEIVPPPTLQDIKMSRIRSYNEDFVNCGNVRFWYDGDKIEYVEFMAFELDIEKFSYVFKMAFDTSLKDVNVKFEQVGSETIINTTKKNYLRRFRDVEFISSSEIKIDFSRFAGFSMIYENMKIIQEQRNRVYE